MNNSIYVLLSVAVGIGAATQLAMLGAMGRERGAYEATWISIVGTIGGLAIVLVIRSFRGDAPNLPAPLDNRWPFAHSPPSHKLRQSSGVARPIAASRASCAASVFAARPSARVPMSTSSLRVVEAETEGSRLRRGPRSI